MKRKLTHDQKAIVIRLVDAHSDIVRFQIKGHGLNMSRKLQTLTELQNEAGVTLFSKNELQGISIQVQENDRKQALAVRIHEAKQISCHGAKVVS